jgi:hypothetical protein
LEEVLRTRLPPLFLFFLGGSGDEGVLFLAFVVGLSLPISAP